MSCQQNNSRWARTIPSMVLAIFLVVPALVQAGQLRVAVASNFAHTLQVLASEFERETGHSLVAITGSTGKHYAQIINGAPYDIFLAADSERPYQLTKHKRFAKAKIKNYALGRLVLWAPAAVSARHAEMMVFENFKYLAIANPKLAPYGASTISVLDALGLTSKTAGRFVMGENIAQTFQFVATGNAELGFVAESQVRASEDVEDDQLWRIPRHLYAPIEQAAVLLRESPASKSFYGFLSSPTALQIIGSAGYDAP